MKETDERDRIVFTLVSAPGGVDGMERGNKGGSLIFATYDRTQAEKKRGLDSRMLLEVIAVDTHKVKKEALAKLTKIERLILDI